jgi:demethylmenaquinone methyltransferase / 2-methoxy-6-polyprenyl-1,4-benzoquinol methylase
VSAETADVRPGSGEMFDRIAERYDLLNRILSLGIDRRWRRHAAAALGPSHGQRILDLATGTGDLAIEVARTPSTVVVGLDPSSRMLDLAKKKVARAGLADRIALMLGDAQALPFGPCEFDGACMAFGIRNVPDRAMALREIARVVKPGGRVAILELSEPRGGLLGSPGRFYVRTLVPRVGALLSGAREYRYLQESIARFPSPPDFARLMTQSGLEVDSMRPLTFGACCLFAGKVLPSP